MAFWIARCCFAIKICELMKLCRAREGLILVWVLERCVNIFRQGRRVRNCWAKRPLQLPLKILFMCDLARMISVLHYCVGVKQAVKQVVLRPEHCGLCVERNGFGICPNDRYYIAAFLSRILIKRHGQWASENIRHGRLAKGQYTDAADDMLLKLF